MTLRDSDDRIVPKLPEVQSGSDKPGNTGAGKAVRISRDPDRASTVLSDGTSVLTRLDRIIAAPMGVQDHVLLCSPRVLHRVVRRQFECDLPAGAGIAK
jgi:hypothetical protein